MVEEFTLSKTYICQMSLRSLWFLSACGPSILTKPAAEGTCCVRTVLSIQHFRNNRIMFRIWAIFNLRVKNIAVKMRCHIPLLKISGSDIFFYLLYVSSSCISLQFLFLLCSSQSWSETWSCNRIWLVGGITDERRWAVSGKVLWKTFNVFYIRVSELSRNTWITQCQPNAV